MRKQSRLMSLAESTVNVLIGYGIACGTQVVIFPWFGLPVTARSTLLIGGIFTVVSIIRSYALRRFFEWIHSRGPEAL